MSESSPSYCELCEQENGNAYNLATHLASKAHRAKVEAVVAEDTERLNTSKSALAVVEQRLKTVNGSIGENDGILNAQREEIETNASTIKEQSEQKQKTAVEVSALKPELDALIQKTEP